MNDIDISHCKDGKLKACNDCKKDYTSGCDEDTFMTCTHCDCNNCRKDELMKDKNIEELLEEIDSLWLYHRHLHKTDDGFEIAKETNLEGRIRELEKKYILIINRPLIMLFSFHILELLTMYQNLIYLLQ